MKKVNPKLLPLFSLIIATAVLYYKRPDAFYHSQFWAEDGAIFFTDAYHYGYISLFNICMGYFHFYPRLVFELALLFDMPLELMPLLACYGWLFMCFVVLVYIWFRLELTRAAKFFIALSVVLIPIEAEVFMNLTNVQWIMAIFPILIFSSVNEEKNRKWFWLDLLILFLCAFTGPNLLVLSPLILFMAFVDRKRYIQSKRQLLLLAMVVISLSFTLFELHNFGRVTRTIGVFDLANPGFIKYLFLQFAFMFIGKLADDIPFYIQALYTGLVLIFLLITFFRLIQGKIKSRFSVFVFFTCLLYLGTTLFAYRYDPGLLDPRWAATRNFYIPGLCFLWFIVDQIQEQAWSKFLFTLLPVLFLYINVNSIGVLIFKNYHWPAYAKNIERAERLKIPINPEGWHVQIDKRLKIRE